MYVLRPQAHHAARRADGGVAVLADNLLAMSDAGRGDWPGSHEEEPDFGPPGPADTPDFGPPGPADSRNHGPWAAAETGDSVQQVPPPPPPPAGPGMPPATPAWNAPGYPGPASRDGGSVGAVVTGGLAILLCVFCALIGIPLAIVAIVLGVQGRKRAAASGAPAGMATAGLIMGVIAIALALLWTIAALSLGSLES